MRVRATVLLVIATTIALLAGTLMGYPTAAVAKSLISAQPLLSTADIVSDHPRLLTSADRFAELSGEITTDPVSKKLYASIVRSADEVLSAPVVEYVKDGGQRLLGVSRTVLDRSYLLAFVGRLTGEKKYVERLWMELDAAASFPDWNPTHFLDTAEMTHAFAIAYDWTYDSWSAAQRERISTAILTMGLEPGVAEYARLPAESSYSQGWPRRSDNINIVNNSAMLLGALAVANDVDISTVQRVIDFALPSISIGMNAYHADGGFAEGPTYWEYATRNIVTLFTALDQSTGSRYGLDEIGGFDRTASFMRALTAPGGGWFGFADSAVRFQPAAVYAGLARVLNQPSLYASAIDADSSAWPVQQLVWRDSGASSVPPPQSLDAKFESGVLTMRGSATDIRASFAGFRFGSQPSGSHQHLDGGDFNFQALGQEWAVDLGLESASYDLLDDNRAEKRLSYYRVGTEGHNTLTLNALSGVAGSKWDPLESTCRHASLSIL